MARLAPERKDQSARKSAPQIARSRLSSKNRGLLSFLEELKSTPDEMGKEWWDEFETELKENRLSFDRLDP